MYTVDQEGATADEKETDIRLRGTRSPQQATIELKIGEKPRSATVLRQALKEQLLKKYMAADDCRAGCLVVTISTNKTWTHPDNGKRIDLNGLIAMLNDEAAKLTTELGGSIRIMAKGLDLRPRLKTERAAAEKSKSRKSQKPTPNMRARARVATKRRTTEEKALRRATSSVSSYRKSRAFPAGFGSSISSFGFLGIATLPHIAQGCED